jgi:ABC-2 type transport system ATP-binding protein
MTAYLSARGLMKRYSGPAVLDGIDAEVRAGDIVGLLGANGSGKTTLLETLLGLSPPSGGSARIFDAEASEAPSALKTRIGFVPQTDELISELRGREYLKLIAAFYPAWDSGLAERLVNEWSIDGGKTISRYSVGQRQKLSIISALAHQPDLLVLDEPVASLDPVARRQFLQQIVELTADARRAVIFSSHIVSDVERLANVIWILKQGRLVWQGDLDRLKESVVRVHAADGAKARASFRRVIVERRGAGGTTLVALRESGEDWADLEARLGAAVQVERLSLEEIFLELHS